MVNIFKDCLSLTSITIPNSVTSIGDYVFSNCSGLTSLTIPGSVKSIGSQAFYGCKGLTSITIPEGVTSIGDYAFYYCSGLTSVTIPNSMTSIGDHAFENCYRLKEIYCEAVTPPDSGGEPFYNVETSKVLLVVPDGSLAQYKAHDVWKQFWIETPTGISPLLTSPEEEPIYDLSGRRLQKMQRGINIVGGKKVAVK